MVTKFDIGDKVFFDLPFPQWGWVTSIRIVKEHIAYEIRTPDGSIHYNKSARKPTALAVG